MVSLDRYVAWVPAQASAGGVLTMTLDMSPASALTDGIPVALTYERWLAGEHETGLEGAWFSANCNAGDPAAPAVRKITNAVVE